MNLNKPINIKEKTLKVYVDIIKKHNFKLELISYISLVLWVKTKFQNRTFTIKLKLIFSTKS